MNLALELLAEIGVLFVRMAPYLVLGMGIAGLLSVMINASFVSRHIGHASLGSIVKASFFGVPLPLCSCSVIPTALFLEDSGASRPAVTGFLISTPQTGVDSIAASYGMLGPFMALYRPLSAFLLGITGGVVSLIAGRKSGDRTNYSHEDIDTCSIEGPSCGCNSHDDHTRGTETGDITDGEHPGRVRGAVSVMKRVFDYGFLEFIDDIGGQFLLGLVLAGMLGVFLPDGFFEGNTLGSGVWGMLTMVIVGIPIYICSTSSIPIAVMLIAKGASLGTAFVFLLAGPATNIATLAVLSKRMGRAFTVRYVSVLVIGSLMFGLLLDVLTAAFPVLLQTVPGAAAVESESLFTIWSVGASILLLVLILRSLYRSLKTRFTKSSAESCNHSY